MGPGDAETVGGLGEERTIGEGVTETIGRGEGTTTGRGDEGKACWLSSSLCCFSANVCTEGLTCTPGI